MAGLHDVRIHDIRHSYASRALSLGKSLPMIGKLLGHRKVQTTARYAHLARDSVKAAAERVSHSLAADHYFALVQTSLAVWERLLPEHFLESTAAETVRTAQPGSFFA